MTPALIIAAFFVGFILACVLASTRVKRLESLAATFNKIARANWERARLSDEMLERLRWMLAAAIEDAAFEQPTYTGSVGEYEHAYRADLAARYDAMCKSAAKEMPKQEEET